LNFDRLAPERRPEIMPRWLHGRCGASVVRCDAAVNRMETPLPPPLACFRRPATVHSSKGEAPSLNWLRVAGAWLRVAGAA
jgi:hypothetical protein